MATNAYMQGRKKYQRPQAMLWADNPGTIVVENEGTPEEQTFYVPLGNEIGSDGYYSEVGEFIILSDDNRDAIEFSQQRLEKRERMVNGRMRSYHIADKLEIKTSWSMLPSRAFAVNPNFLSHDDPIGKPQVFSSDNYVLTDSDNNPNTPGVTTFNKSQQYTTDGGAGGVELLDWYKNHTGSFWVYLSYDNYANFKKLNDTTPYDNLNKYSQIVEVMFTDFSHSVVKRGGTNYDFWDISVTLEEV